MPCLLQSPNMIYMLYALQHGKVLQESLPSKAGHTCALKDIENIMNIELCQPMWKHSSCQVRMAVVVKILSSQHGIDIRIASGAEQVMYPSTLSVLAIVFQTVPRDRDHGPQKRKDGPQPIKDRDVCCLQLTCAGCPHALARVVEVP